MSTQSIRCRALIAFLFYIASAMTAFTQVEATSSPLKPSIFNRNRDTVNHQVTFTNKNNYDVVFSATLKNGSSGPTNICEGVYLKAGDKRTYSREITTAAGQGPEIETVEKRAEPNDRNQNRNVPESAQQDRKKSKTGTEAASAGVHEATDKQAIVGRYVVNSRADVNGRTWSLTGRLTFNSDGSGAYVRTINEKLHPGMSWIGKNGELINNPKSIRDSSTYSVRWNMESDQSIRVIVQLVSKSHAYPPNIQWSDRFGQEKDDIGKARQATLTLSDFGKTLRWKGTDLIFKKEK